jgi:hypothetical protein
MNKDNTDIDQIEAEMITYELSDEALESAAEPTKYKGGSVTVAFCSGLDTCPA